MEEKISKDSAQLSKELAKKREEEIERDRPIWPVSVTIEDAKKALCESWGLTERATNDLHGIIAAYQCEEFSEEDRAQYKRQARAFFNKIQRQYTDRVSYFMHMSSDEYINHMKSLLEEEKHNFACVCQAFLQIDDQPEDQVMES